MPRARTPPNHAARITARSYTPAVLSPYTDKETFVATPRLTTCRDPSLSAAQQAACMACLSIRDRRACLARTAATFYGAGGRSAALVLRWHARGLAAPAHPPIQNASISAAPPPPWPADRESCTWVGGVSRLSRARSGEVRFALGVNQPDDLGMWLGERDEHGLGRVGGRGESQWTWVGWGAGGGVPGVAVRRPPITRPPLQPTTPAA